jgi:hypothetical protein
VILKECDVIFFLSWAKHIIGNFKRFWGQKGFCPLEKSHKMTQFCFVREKKITYRILRISGTLIFLRHLADQLNQQVSFWLLGTFSYGPFEATLRSPGAL